MHTVQKDTTFTKIFVGGLPYHTTDSSLRKYFEVFGDIDEAVVITDRQTGKSRGYGFTCRNPLKAQGFTIGVQQLHPAFIQRPFGLTPQYIYPPTIVQPSVVIPTQIQSLPSPYIDYNAATQAYTHYTTAAYEQYPFAASPATTYGGYSFTSAVPQPISATTTGATPTTYIQYPPQQLQPDRMQ
ncbi:hypothetical protein GDO86_014530 [Hymenochirus boettgeri]|uniref:RRM domain-containing protein n=1 Tax=Hymenochirus boettgeri TaxID=247094 RepID=A0A8T2JUZ0_9PIPI|nr:hypothetical protein GDO86_014530 [Hymenochirus boettgeri]